MDLLNALAEFFNKFGALGISVVLLAGLIYVYKEKNACIDLARKQAQEAAEAVVTAYKLRSDEIRELAVALDRSVNSATASIVAINATMEKRNLMHEKQTEAIQNVESAIDRDYWVGRFDTSDRKLDSIWEKLIVIGPRKGGV